MSLKKSIIMRRILNLTKSVNFERNVKSLQDMKKNGEIINIEVVRSLFKDRCGRFKKDTKMTKHQFRTALILRKKGGDDVYKVGNMVMVPVKSETNPDYDVYYAYKQTLQEMVASYENSSKEMSDAMVESWDDIIYSQGNDIEELGGDKNSDESVAMFNEEKSMFNTFYSNSLKVKSEIPNTFKSYMEETPEKSWSGIVNSLEQTWDKTIDVIVQSWDDLINDVDDYFKHFLNDREEYWSKNPQWEPVWSSDDWFRKVEDVSASSSSDPWTWDPNWSPNGPWSWVTKIDTSDPWSISTKNSSGDTWHKM